MQRITEFSLLLFMTVAVLSVVAALALGGCSKTGEELTPVLLEKKTPELDLVAPITLETATFSMG